MKFNFKTTLVFLSFLFCSSLFAQGNDARLGLSLGGINWGNSILGVSYHQKGLIPYIGWTAGAELDLIQGGFVLSPRVLYWQKANLSGFYGGPSVSLGVRQSGSFNYTYSGSYDNAFVGFGAEAGWLYRFPLKFDAGVAADFQATTNGLWLGIKATVGYLIR